MSDAPPARRLTDSARRTLNTLTGQGIPLATAMRQVARDPDAFEPVVLAVSRPPPAEAPQRPAWKGDRTDWRSAVEKLGRLRQLDRGEAAFGAASHHYALGPTASERHLASLEKKLGVALPPGLRAFYETVGNGGAGPGYGVYDTTKLKRARPALPYPGIAALRALGAQPQPPEWARAVVPPSRLTGLLSVLTMGSGIYSAVVCTGDVGRVVTYDEDGVAESDQTLVELYEEWLDEELAQFELVQRLRDAGATREEMTEAMTALLPRDRARTVSLVVHEKLRGLGTGAAER